MANPELGHPISDGTVTLRASKPEDDEVLVNGRDVVYHRFMGEGHPEPSPLACILVEGAIVGWIDYDSPRPWLTDGEVNVGYNVFPEYRGRGYATRALELLVRSLRDHPTVTMVTALIDPDNEASLGVALRAGFIRHDDVDGERFYKRSTATPASDDQLQAQTGDPSTDRDHPPGG